MAQTGGVENWNDGLLFSFTPSTHPSEDKLNYLSIQYFCMPPSKLHSPLRHTAPGKKLNDPGQRLKVVTKGRPKKLHKTPCGGVKGPEPRGRGDVHVKCSVGGAFSLKALFDPMQ
ncbi:hypothetical protein CEXT_216711 [Caerostris extrusa]|uniref:Uncharacterized protein n=1 Tax=Caerostris extrusa TaxID=172846 RepID=A0AAV4VT13_CAEEX|nr:hypothetical protein CEXT_216711 [Caerostris extrusa]